jgi:hydrogenase maturation protease
MWENKILVLGVGNVLKENDGLGPVFIEQFDRRQAAKDIKERIETVDVGTGLTPFLLDVYMFPGKPSAIIIVDSFLGTGMNDSLKEGEVFELDPSSWESKSEVGSIESHKLPPGDLLAKLRNQGVKVRILVCKVNNIPEEVNMGLSDPIIKAIPRICEEVDTIINDIS